MDDSHFSSSPYDKALEPNRKTSPVAIPHSRIEELSLEPGAEKSIRILYCPEQEEVQHAFCSTGMRIVFSPGCNLFFSNVNLISCDVCRCHLL